MAVKGGLPADNVLVERLLAKDEDVFRLLMGSWTPGMLRLARAFVTTNATAEDVVQDTWLAVLGALDRYEGRSSLKTWVYRILVNTAKNRAAKEGRTVPFGSLLPEDEGPAVVPSRFRPSDDPPAGHWAPGSKPQLWPGPEEHVLAGEIGRIVASALAELPQRHRLVVTLRDVEGYASEEVCDMLQISPGNQRVLLHRGRAAVRGRLEEYSSSVSDTTASTAKESERR
ncbi:sigma-70 family RNA polymerase sigma factor [Kitasatospora sp. NPDC096128]|uniref:RNA polymerase sigma factor n=1 Tax=Kitasatospora sp. NPDC096128 TaxID=3155547 RepID=UPI00331ABAFD